MVSEDRHLHFIDRVLLIYSEIEVGPGKLLKILENWGPAHQVDFDVWIDRFNGEVIHLTTGVKCCRLIGSQVIIIM